MKFSKKIEQIKSQAENKGKIVLIRCGIFFTAIGTDAILLNKNIIRVKAYNETADYIYRKLKKSEIIVLSGKMRAKEVECSNIFKTY